MKQSFSDFLSRPHLAAGRMTTYALTLGDYETWADASDIWQVRLTPRERAAQAWAALRSLEPDDALLVAETVLDGAGMPLPPFFSPMSDAAFWVSIANPAELDAYALACVRAMTPERRAAFLDYMHQQVAA